MELLARPPTASISVSSDPGKHKADETAQAKPKEDEVLETETIKGKNGAVITRTTKKDGSVNVKRVSSNGKVNIQLDNIYDMAGGLIAFQERKHFPQLALFRGMA